MAFVLCEHTVARTAEAEGGESNREDSAPTPHYCLMIWPRISPAPLLVVWMLA